MLQSPFLKSLGQRCAIPARRDPRFSGQGTRMTGPGQVSMVGRCGKFNRLVE